MLEYLLILLNNNNKNTYRRNYNQDKCSINVESAFSQYKHSPSSVGLPLGLLPV